MVEHVAAAGFGHKTHSRRVPVAPVQLTVHSIMSSSPHQNLPAQAGINPANLPIKLMCDALMVQRSKNRTTLYLNASKLLMHRLSPPSSELVDYAPNRKARGVFSCAADLQAAAYHCDASMKTKHLQPGRLPEENPDGARLRRGRRIGAGAGPHPEPAAAQQGAAQARGPAAGVQLQAARRLQQDGAAERRAAAKGRDLRLGRQPRAGRGAVARTSSARAP